MNPTTDVRPMHGATEVRRSEDDDGLFEVRIHVTQEPDKPWLNLWEKQAALLEIETRFVKDDAGSKGVFTFAAIEEYVADQTQRIVGVIQQVNEQRKKDAARAEERSARQHEIDAERDRTAAELQERLRRLG